MTIITASDVAGDRDSTRDDQHQAEALESERAQATVTPEAPIRTDGGDGGVDDLPQLHVADTVEDCDDPDANMLVHALPSEPACEHEIDEKGTTVANINQDYPATDDVVVVTFPQRTDSTLGPLQTYAYPRSRIRLVDSFHDGDGDEEVSE